MSSTFANLNLRPHERRLLVVVGALFFVVLNMWFVWPHFGDWKTVRDEIDQERTKLERYQKVIAETPKHQARLAELENMGTEVASEQRALQLQTLVEQQARANQVNVTRYDPRARARDAEENQFFDEAALAIEIDTGHEELVKFLVDLATDSSIIRVRDLDVYPDQSHTRLKGRVTLVASYRKQEGGATNAVPSRLQRRTNR